MNRAEIFASVTSELIRDDKIDFYPEWLRSAEFRLNNLLRDREMVTRAILPVADTFFALPDDFLEQESMSVQDGSILGDVVPRQGRGTILYAPSAQIDDNPGAFLSSGGPRWFTTRGKYVELVGWPQITNPFQIVLWYYAKLDPLTKDTDTNWLTRDAPHMYKNAMLVFAYNHLEEYETSDRMLQTVAAEAAAMNDRTQSMKTGTGPLIRRSAPKMGGRFS